MRKQEKNLLLFVLLIICQQDGERRKKCIDFLRREQKWRRFFSQENKEKAFCLTCEGVGMNSPGRHFGASFSLERREAAEAFVEDALVEAASAAAFRASKEWGSAEFSRVVASDETAKAAQPAAPTVHHKR